MTLRSAAALLIAAVAVRSVIAQTATFPVLDITKGAPLPTLQQLQPVNDWITLNMLPATIQGPGENTSADDPYVLYTGRTYNEALIAGVIRVQQRETLRLKVCNNLSSYEPTATGEINSSYGSYTHPIDVGGINVFKDVNILANHLHGFYGNPGTDNIACDPLPDSLSACYRGDNIFADILPESCNYYQYDIAEVASPGALWIHPHHHGSSSLQTHTATVPVIIDVASTGGFDPLSSASCANMRQYFPADHSNEIILHFQTFQLAVFTNASQNIQNATGPIDDGFIANSVRSTAGDPYCCAGPEPLDDGTAVTTWDNTGDTGPHAGNSSSLLPFYTSGSNALFATINGVYQPVISMNAGTVYRWILVEAATMKWMHLSFDKPGCMIGLYSRDANYVNELPRMTDNIVLAAANRVELLIQCDAGTYQLQSGQGEFGTQDPGCGSSHCDVIKQLIMATVEVAAVAGVGPVPADPFGSCTPQRPAYQQDLRDTSLNATYRNEIVPKTGNTGVLNFTNPRVPGLPSSACSLNGLTYQDSNAMQEVIGELHELSLWNINVHPYHHHTQPFQIVALPNGVDSDTNNGSWRIGDWADTLELPNIGYQAIVRWVPGPYDITGTGYAVLHCHILPHEDEGCMMKTQILAKAWAPEPNPSGAHSQGGKAGLAIMVLVIFIAAVVVPVMLWKQKKKRRAMAAAEADSLVRNEYAATENAGHEV